MSINLRIAGEAGQGVQTTGLLLTRALAQLPIHLFSTQSYMSRIRGGLNWIDIRIDNKELFSGRQRCDLLVALTTEAMETLKPTVADGGTILYDGQANDDVISIRFAQVAKEIAGSPIAANSVAAGAVFAWLGFDNQKLSECIKTTFKKHGEDAIAKNIDCAHRGAELMGDRRCANPVAEDQNAPTQIYGGSDVIGLAAATAGIKLASSYPMTPSTGVFTYLASVADKYGIIVEQAEDEIAAINMICGAVYSGVPAMTTTSGGGFALMVEGISLAGMLELPALILLSQRPGPATGMPTRTAQEDLGLAIHAGHGEFPRAIFAPGTLEQAHQLMRHAIEIAHRYQVPVIFMTDQFLVDIQKTMATLDTQVRPIDRCLADSSSKDYVRYAVTDSGVSPRAIPGGSAFVVCDSDEHAEDGHITEDFDARIRLQDKRLRKGKALLAECLEPILYGPSDAEHLLLTWGSTYGPAREAVDSLQADGKSVAMLHFAQVWPIDAARVRALLEPFTQGGRKITSVEGNSTGQLAAVLREVGVLNQCDLLLRYDGLPFTGGEIARRIMP